MTLPDIDALANYGGVLKNYAPVADPTTDLDSSFSNKVRTSVAAASQTQIRALVLFTTAATTAGLVLVGYRSVWGNAPAVAPLLTRVATGQYQITQPATVADELGAVHVVSIFAAAASFEGASAYNCDAYPFPRFGNIVTVNLFTSAGAATDAVGTTMLIEMF